MAYQGYGHGLGRAAIARLQALVLGDFSPDLTLILDVPVDVGLARAAGRTDGEDRYERLGHDFHERLREAYRDLAVQEPARCALIDAAGEVAVVHAAVKAEAARRLGVVLS